MKKTIVFLAVAVLFLGVVGCFNRNNDEDDADKGGNNQQQAPEGLVEELEALIKEMYDNLGDVIQIFPMIEEIPFEQAERIETLTGITDLSDIEAVVNGGAAINVIPYEMALVQVRDGADVNAIMSVMESSIDLGQLICVEMDAAIITNAGNLILIVMGTREEVDAVYAEFGRLRGPLGRKIERVN